jgi:hypothetical protein
MTRVFDGQRIRQTATRGLRGHILTDAPDSSCRRAARRCLQVRRTKRLATGARRHRRRTWHGVLLAPDAIDRGLVDCLPRLRTLMTARAPISAVGVAAMLSVSLTACAQRTTTVTQPLSDAPPGRPIGGDPPTTEPGGQDARGAAKAFLSSYLVVLC